METPRQTWARLRGLWRRRELESGLDEEILFHIERQTEKNLRAGMSLEEARRDALLRFGGVRRVKEEVRDEVRPAWLEDLGKDLRFGARTLLRSRGFAVVAALTIALGIGSTTAVFSLLQHILLRPLPYPGAERLVVPQSQSLEDGNTWSVAYADYRDWKRAGVFSEVALYQAAEVNVAGSGEAERLQGAVVTEDFFATLALAPTLGRFFRPDEFEAGSPRVAVISHELWQRRFGGDRGAVGRLVRVAGFPREIVGIAPAGMGYPADAEIWFPLRIAPESRPDYERRDNFVFGAIARLAPGRSLEQTRTRLATLAAAVAEERPEAREGVTVTATRLIDEIVGDRLPRALWLFLGAVGLVLLIGCLNVANLLLSRSAGRSREFAIRGSLGAGRGRLVRQLLTESLVLALGGGLLGVGLAYGATALLVRIAPPGTPRLEQAGLDLRAVAFAFGVSLLAAALFGLAPALGLSRERLSGALGEGDRRSTTGARSRGLRNLLAVAEIGLSFTLLVGAGLLFRSLDRLRDVDPGFETRNLLAVPMVLQGERYEEGEVVEETFRELTAGIEALPGVEDAATVSALPLGGGGFYLGRAFLAEGQPEPPAGEDLQGMWSVVSPGYFATMGIPLLRGREFTGGDRSESPPVMVVNREFARRMFPDGEALGKRVRSWRDENLYREIVGVVEDVRFFGAGDELRPLAFVPHSQNPWSSMALVVRTAGDPGAAVRPLREVIARVDPALAVGEVRMMERVFSESVAPQRFGALLVGAFASIALALALIGVYGVLSYGVAQRSREFGIRMALGARGRSIRAMVVREGALVSLVGIGVGVAGALLLTRLMSGLLYEVETTDPATYVGVAALFGAVALVACWIPATRASRVDPMTAIRVE